jgi:hypothetical protein
VRISGYPAAVNERESIRAAAARRKAAHPDVDLWLGESTDDDFVAALAGRMTAGDAQAIRLWRTDHELTWRQIAAIATAAIWRTGGSAGLLGLSGLAS